jgi:hypothetical protein
VGHFLWSPGIDAYASYTEIIKFSEKEGIGFGLYAADSHSILSDYFPLAAVQKSWINFRSRHQADRLVVVNNYSKCSRCHCEKEHDPHSDKPNTTPMINGVLNNVARLNERALFQY